MKKLGRMVHWFAVCQVCALVHCCGAWQVLAAGRRFLKLWWENDFRTQKLEYNLLRNTNIFIY